MADGLAKRVIETVGFVGVVGSLIFVGLEVRQNSVAIQAATNASVAEAFHEQNMMLASSPELAAALARNVESPESGSIEDVIQILGAWRGAFHIWSNAHRQHLDGTLHPAIFASVVQEISTYATKSSDDSADNPVTWRKRQMRWAWENERFIYNPDFQAFVDETIGFDN